MQNGLTTISKVIFHLSSNIGKLLQVALVGVCVVFLVGCKQLVDDQSAEEKSRCVQKCDTNKCSGFFATNACKQQCILDCGCTYSYANGGGYISYTCKGD